MGMIPLQTAVLDCSLLFGADCCVCLSLRVVFPPPFLTGFFKVLGQLTETGVVSPEQFISEYFIIPWHFHRESKDPGADSKAAQV